MECLIYSLDGRVQPFSADMDGIVERAGRLTEHEFAWIETPAGDKDALHALTDALGLHPLTVRESVDGSSRPRRERAGEQLYLVLRSVHREGSDVCAAAVRVLAGRKVVVTVTDDTATLATARDRLTRHPELVRQGTSGVVYVVISSVVDAYEQIAEELRQELRDLEEQVFAPGRSDLSQDIYVLKRAVLELNDAVEPLVPITEDLLGEDLPGQVRHYLRDAAHRIRRVDGMINGMDELLNSVANAHLARVSTRQNDDMRRISAWAAVLAVPTVITGIYGMNFASMPELHLRYGYPGVLLLMLALSVVIYVVFKRNRWI
ncbi:magnesium transporter CorA [Microtetraspora sp. NBRC 13810]|uniref:magnesium and cobalt transport protein CorA n=1 Tax=Microtetraspora sp. NBRC 13810 TaxID=3030990 RepID=UPI0024A57FEE|nr:magnesium and cobalt transport protein CorA [Microtetraspora sp. NBRC 13810]GLW06921.1 magnesium transporter CorA [Microtetraspora sp. NBRC 13810]